MAASSAGRNQHLCVGQKSIVGLRSEGWSMEFPVLMFHVPFGISSWKGLRYVSTELRRLCLNHGQRGQADTRNSVIFSETSFCFKKQNF